MVRVVSKGGTVAAYAWDMPGGGFPLQPIQSEMFAMGFPPLRPPSAQPRCMSMHPRLAQRLDCRRKRYRAGAAARTTRNPLPL